MSRFNPAKPGKSAYDLWLEAGNIGTKTDFLNSLKGDPCTGSGSGILTFDTLSALQTAHPNGLNVPIWVEDEKAWYYWEGEVTAPSDITAPTLTITPAATFSDTQSIRMSTEAGATIYYTLDGSTPTQSSAIYSTTLTISSTTTLKAFARDTAGNSSAVQTVVYTKDESAPADTIAPTDVTGLTASSTHNSITLNWTASVSSDVTSYVIFEGATEKGSSVETTFTITSGLSASTSYTYTVKARDGAGNLSTGVNITVSTSTPASTPYYMVMNGTSDYFQAPSMTFDEIQFEYAATNQSDTAFQYYLDGRTGSTLYVANTDTGKLEYSNTSAKVYIDGIFKPSGSIENNPLPSSRKVMKVITNAAVTDDVVFFTRNNYVDFMGGRIYRIKVLLAGFVQAYYDFTKQISGSSVIDSSGNGRAGTLNGGVSTLDSETIPVAATPQYIALNGTDNKLKLPVPGKTKYMELKLKRKNNDVSGYLFDMRYNNVVGIGNPNNVFAMNSTVSGYSAVTVNGQIKTVGGTNVTTDLPNETLVTAKFTLTSATISGGVTIGGHNHETAVAADYHTLDMYEVSFFDESSNLLDKFTLNEGQGAKVYSQNNMIGTVLGEVSASTWAAE